MPLINSKKEFVKAVSLIVETDMGMVEDLFPTVRTMKTEEIEWDSAVVEGVSPEFTSFAETAKVITKDGKSRFSLKPVNFNNAISKEQIDADAEQFGQNEYGDGDVDAETESALNGVAKHHLNAKVGIKKIAYEALTTFKIAEGYIGMSGKEDIVFPVPDANKEIFDGTNKKYWSNSESTPVTDIDRAVKAMKIKPSRVVMNENTFANFLNNGEVRTADNSTTGTKRNFIQNENVDIEAKYYTAGRLTLPSGKTVDVKVENEQRFTGSSYVPFLDDGYVIYASPLGVMHYGGIPVAEKGVGVRRIRAEFDVQELITQNPPQHLLQYRTAPLPTLKQGEAYYVQQVEV